MKIIYNLQEIRLSPIVKIYKKEHLCKLLQIRSVNYLLGAIMKNTKSLICMVIYFAIFSFLLNTPSLAQSFEILNIESKNFPNMEAFYIAKDASGNPNSSLTLKEFEVSLNGKMLSSAAPSNLKQDCQVENYATPFAAVLLLDCSTSMNDEVSYGTPRFKWMEKGVAEFIDSLRMNPKSRMKVVPFSTDERTGSNWSNDKVYLNKWIDDNMNDYYGATDFNDALLPSLDKNKKGAVNYLKEVDQSLPKFIIMITDGKYEGPDEFRYQEVIDSCIANDIVFYSISIQTNVDSGLNYLANDSKGKTYTASKESDVSYYLQKILQKIEIRNVCRFTWVNPYICEGDSKTQNLEVTCKYYGITDTESYTLDDNAVATAEVSDNKLFVGSISKGQNSATFQISADKTNFTVSDYAISGDPDKTKFTISPKPPFTVSASTPTEVTVTYVKDPADPSAKYTLSFTSTPCDIPVVDIIAPCYGESVSVIDFGDVPVGSVTPKTQTAVLKNTTPEPISGNVILEGKDAADFTITAGGGAFTINPGSSLDVTIEINPNLVGVKTANLNFQIENADYCGNSTTDITANAQATNFPIQPIAFGLNRVSNKLTITHSIANTRQSDATIKSMKLENNSGAFNLITPFTGSISAGSSEDITIEFTPDAEGNFDCDLVLDIEDLDNPVIAKVTGIGGVPIIDAKGNTYAALKAGQKSAPMNVTIQNTSNYMDMHIEEIKFANPTNDFEIVSGTKLKDIIVQKGAKIDIPVVFTPTKGGMLTANIQIINDALAGMEPVTYQTTTVEVKGEGLALQVNPTELNFGNILSCDAKTMTVTIPNNSTSEMTVSLALSGTNTSEFALDKSDLSIPAAGNGTFDVLFQPTQNGSFTAQVDIVTNNGTAIVALNGSAYGTEVMSSFKQGTADFNMAQIAVISGLNSIVFELETNLPNDLIDLPSEITYNLNMDYKYSLRYLDNSFIPASGWTLKEVNTSEEDNGKLSITITPTASAGKNVKSKIALKGYIADTDSLNINLSVDFPAMPCLISKGDNLPVKLISCFTEGNLIDLSEYQMGKIKINGNPAIETSTIDFSIAYDTYVEIYIYDSMGKKVATLHDGILKEGNYSDKVPYELLESGVYNITMRAGVYHTTTRLAIIK